MASTQPPNTSSWASKYRGATVEDLDPPPALSTSPAAPVASALVSALDHDYTHLTVISSDKSLLGYISIPTLQSLLKDGKVANSDPVQGAMIKFKRKGNRYKLITMETPLLELESFFNGDATGSPQDFAVVTDPARRFVLGVATRADLQKFAERRPF